MDSRPSPAATVDDHDVPATAPNRVAAGRTVDTGSLRADPPARVAAVTLEAAPSDPRRYPIAGEHARGGLGRILEAFDQRLGRVVAIKELVDSSRAGSARFIREGLMTARLEHPNIVPVHEVGRWPSGEPFYVMKFVSGRALDEIIGAAQTFDRRLALLPHVIAVADALAYAHSHRIIHRDLKPSNVMVGAFGETVLIDWGLAKDLRAPEEQDDGPMPVPLANEMATRTGAVLGTPAYMPPEQARGEPVDERADVYALGALLYHLLVGHAPYTHGRADTVLAQVLAGPPPAVELRQPGVPPDLAAVVHKAMARAPADRYSTARELVEDLRRFHEGRLVSAHHYTRTALLGRWFQRHRVPVAVGALALIALAGMGVTSARSIVAERNRAQARANQLLLAQARAALERDPTEALAWLKTYPDTGADWAEVRRLGIEADRRGVARHVLGSNGFWGFSEDNRHWLARILDVDGKSQAFVLRDLDTGRIDRRSPVPQGLVPLATAPSGRFVAVRSADGQRFGLLDLERSRLVPLGPIAGRLACAFSDDNRWVALGATDGSLRVWAIDAADDDRSADHAPSLTAQLDGPVEAVAFSADSRWLVSRADEPALVRLWEVSGPQRHVLGGMRAPGFSYALWADATQLAFSNGDPSLWLWSPASNTRRRIGSTPSRITHLAITADGRSLVTGEQNGAVTVWSVPAATARPLLPNHPAALVVVAFAPDGQHLVSVDDSGEGRWWAVASGEAQALGHGLGRPYDIAFSRDGQFIATRDPTLGARVWHMPREPERVFSGPTQEAHQVVFSPDGRLVVASSDDNNIYWWDRATTRHGVLQGHAGPVRWLAFAPGTDRIRLASTGFDATVRLWDLSPCIEPDSRPCTPESRVLSQGGRAAGPLLFTPDGRRLVVSGIDGVVRVWEIQDTQRGVLFAQVPTGMTGSAAMALSPDGQALALGSAGGEVQWVRLTGERLRSLGRGQGEVAGLGFSPDGRQLVAATRIDRSVRLWHLDPPREILLGSHETTPKTIAFAPDGRHVALAAEDGSLRLWDLATGRTQSLAGHAHGLHAIAFAPSGCWLASAGQDHALRLWDVAQGDLVDVFWHPGELFGIGFAPDGARLAAVGSQGTVRLWRTDPGIPATAPHQLAPLRAWMTQRSTAQLNPHDRPLSP